VSRHNLNIALVDEAFRAGAVINFDCQCIDLDEETGEVTVLHKSRRLRESAALILAADGSNSIVRSILTKRGILKSSQTPWKNGYKELQVLASPNGQSFLEPNALHLWPRQNHMAIAFPNHDRSFTCAVHMPFEGTLSFKSLRVSSDAIALFRRSFPDLLDPLSTLTPQFLSQRPNTMETVKCEPWGVRGKILLIGDAAHAVLPSYGQGANAGFEDCRLLDEAFGRFGPDWEATCAAFEQVRRPDMDVLAELCRHHFVELCDLVAEESFQLRRRIERRIQQMFPDRFSSLYSMISFSSLSYSQAELLDRQQTGIIDKLAQIPGIEDELEGDNLGPIFNKMLRRAPAITSISKTRRDSICNEIVSPG
jgi:kynurenine 3-monooxygenase